MATASRESRLGRFATLVCGLLAAGAARADIVLSLAYVDTQSTAWDRFVSWVDQALDGTPPYGFSATDAAYVARVLGPGAGDAYAELAVDTVEAQVVEAETEIAAGERPPIAYDSYLEVGPFLHDLALVYDWCAPFTTPRPARALGGLRRAGGLERLASRTKPSGAAWRTPGRAGRPAIPGNNYHFSFLEATMYWALASDSTAWRDFLEDVKLPPPGRALPAAAGGGSREGTGYGLALMRLFELYRLWQESTGQDLGAASPHLADTIDYWIHATPPSFDRYAPIGDLARESYPWLYDYHRRLLLEARAATAAEGARRRATWWLNRISVDEMQSTFNYRHDLLPAGAVEEAPATLFHHATGAGHLFARTSWQPDALWLAVVAGPYDQSHAHRDQGSFSLFRGDFLAVTENVFSHSGIQQGSEVHDTLRFERAGQVVAQRESVSTLQIATQSDRLVATADLAPAFVGTDAVDAWQRRFELDTTGLLVDDPFDAAPDVTAYFQVQVPVQPSEVAGRIVAGDLTIVPILPAGATVELLEWSTVDAVRVQFRLAGYPWRRRPRRRDRRALRRPPPAPARRPRRRLRDRRLPRLVGDRDGALSSGRGTAPSLGRRRARARLARWNGAESKSSS